ncbi:MAG: hypothetical protein HY909_25845 [Deltaproteobacteria bacterium]|nr:hypothetical protein [Deltaproteobacteria bacterium]
MATPPIDSTRRSYVNTGEPLGGIRGLAASSVNTVMAALRRSLGSISDDLRDIQAHMQGHMDAANQARNELNFLRSVNSAVTRADGRLDDAARTPALLLADCAKYNIDPRSAEGRALLASIGREPDGSHSMNPRPSDGSEPTRSTGVGKAQLEAAVRQAEGRLESINNALQNDGRTLQSLMNHRSEAMNTISQLMSSEHESAMAAIRNIK